MITSEWATVPASGHANSNCAQTRRLPNGEIELRNDRNVNESVRFTPGEWSALRKSFAAGDLDIPATQ